MYTRSRVITAVTYGPLLISDMGTHLEDIVPFLGAKILTVCHCPVVLQWTFEERNGAIVFRVRRSCAGQQQAKSGNS